MKKPLAALAGLIILSGCTIVPGTNATPMPVPSATPQPAPGSASKPACQTDLDELRFKTAYVVNASGFARFGYYQLGRSSNEYLAAGAKKGLEDRFSGAALAYLTQQTVGWPMDVQVNLPGIEVTSFTESADCSKVTLQTKETWHVAASGHPDQVLFQESAQPHTVQMEKAAGVATEKWIVTSIS